MRSLYTLQIFFFAICLGITVHAQEQKLPQEMINLIGEFYGINTANKDGYSPLQIAVKEKNVDQITLAIQLGANINHCDLDNETVLFDAVEGNKYKIIALLIQAGATIDCKNNKGVTPLSLAMCQDQKESMELLIKSHADIQTYDNDGYNLLHYAVINNPTMIPLLLKIGVDIHAKNNDGQTFLKVAKRWLPDKEIAAIKKMIKKQEIIAHESISAHHSISRLFARQYVYNSALYKYQFMQKKAPILNFNITKK